MADALTTTSSVDFDQTAYDRFAYYALRPELYFDGVADVQPTAQSVPGAAVVFTQVSDMSVASTALNQSVDVDAIAMADSQVTLTLAEYGNVMKTTAKLRGVSFIGLDPVVANVIGYNAGVSIDTVARDVLGAGSNVRYATGGTTVPTARNTIEPEDVLKGNNARRAVAELRGANAATTGNGLYTAFIHPDVSYDFRGETSGAGWRDVHTYTLAGNISNGSIGAFEGAEFIETPRAPLFADAGSSTTLTDVYRTIWVGQQALAKAYSYTDGNGAFPKVVMTPVVDNLRRFQGFGWYWLGTYGRFREACIRAYESSSSIGTNA